MLVTMKEILDRANAGCYGVVAPNVTAEMDARACIEVAEDENSPLILDVAMIHTSDIFFHGSYLTRLADSASVPVAINLDHGATFEDAIKAIRSGFTSIMVDRSSLPYEENLEQVKELVRIAHAVDVSVEAELGHVGTGSSYNETGNDLLTDPNQALDYIKQTGIDCLAVAIGTAHGAYVGVPHLDFERLIAIKNKVGIPLVLHGGSGTGDDNIAKACKLGINKVNVCNELFKNMYDSVMANDLTGDNAYEFWNVALAGLKKRMHELIHICGCNNKAWIPERKGLPRNHGSMKET